MLCYKWAQVTTQRLRLKKLRILQKNLFKELLHMSRIKNLLGIFAFSLLILGLPALVAAQGGNRRNDRDRDNNNWYNANQLKDTIKHLKSDTKDFVKFVDKDLDKSKYDGSRREDSLNNLALQLRDAASRLESRFNGRNLDNSENEANEVLRLARRVDGAMRRVQLSPNVEAYWKNIDRQLDQVARAYRRNNRGWRNN